MAVGRGNSVAPLRVDAEVLSPAEYARIQGLRSRAANRVAALRSDLEELETALAGRAASALQQGPATRPRLSFYTSLLSEALTVPVPRAELGAAGLLAQYGQYGLRERSFDAVVPVTAPQPINYTGNYYDAGSIYDAWILNPSCDTKFDFERMPNQNTPYISANSRMQFQVRKQKVWYQANTPGLTGTLQIWLLAFSGT